jgi:probable rRNA maturation factor
MTPGVGTGPGESMTIDINDETRSEQLTDDLRELASFLMSRLGMDNSAELSVSLVREDHMTDLHEEWLGEPGPTDVVSIPMDELREPGPGDSEVTGVLGDVIICPAVAERQAMAVGHQTQDEMRILLTHGVLHLLGNDHADTEEANQMFSRQAQLIAEYSERRGR